MSRPPALDRIQIAGLGDSVGDLAEQARAAEAAGIDCVWAVELFRSSLTQAMWLAASTESIAVGTGIAWAFTRSPMMIALSALDIDEASGGRFRLGLGAGVKRLNETWHGVDYGRPAPHLRETVEAVRLIIERCDSGEPIRYEGKYHDIDIKGWVRPHPKLRDTIPIYTAAVQEGMARMAGDVSDGMIGHPMCSMRWLDEVLVANFELGLERSRRERSSFDFLPTVCCAIDDDEEAAYEAARRTICFYATVRTYTPLWEMHGFGDAGGGRGRRVPPRRLRRHAARPSPTRWSTPTARRDRSTRSARAWPRSPSGATASGSPPSYFIEPPEIAAYQRRIIEGFAPSTPG